MAGPYAVNNPERDDWEDVKPRLSELTVNMRDSHGDTRLHNAVASGVLSDVKRLLMRWKAKTSLRNKQGDSPLHIAARNGQFEIAELLISRGAKLDLRNYKGESPLHVATKKGQNGLVQLLINRGAELNLRNCRGESPLHIATRKGQFEASKLLLGRGANPNTKCFYRRARAKTRNLKYAGCPSLLIAVERGDRKFIDLLLKRASIKVPLKLRRVNGSRKIVRVSSVRLNAVNREGLTALHLAVKNGDEAMVRKLLGRASAIRAISYLFNRCYLKKKTPEGKTPLMLAEQYGHDNIASLLSSWKSTSQVVKRKRSGLGQITSTQREGICRPSRGCHSGLEDTWVPLRDCSSRPEDTQELLRDCTGGSKDTQEPLRERPSGLEETQELLKERASGPEETQELLRERASGPEETQELLGERASGPEETQELLGERASEPEDTQEFLNFGRELEEDLRRVTLQQSRLSVGMSCWSKQVEGHSGQFTEALSRPLSASPALSLCR